MSVVTAVNVHEHSSANLCGRSPVWQGFVTGDGAAKWGGGASGVLVHTTRWTVVHILVYHLFLLP